MQEKHRFNRILAAALISVFLLVSAGLAVAGDATGAKPDRVAACPNVAEPGERAAALQSVLDKLVAEKALTQEQADKLVSYFKTQLEQRKAQREQMKNLTPEQRQALRKEAPLRKGFLDQAVDDKIITQEQAQAIKEALREQKQHSREAAFQARLAELVKRGTISQSQADAAWAALQTHWQAQRAELEKIKELSAEERMNYLRSKSAEKQHPLQGLIDNGTLTQEQAEQICPVQKTGCKMKNPGRKGCPRNPARSGSNA